ncbi:MAG: EVE domain-containing protein [Planctomycetota bacterium]
MKYWLVKSEPGSWSWQDHWSKRGRVEPWDGVRNHQAKANMVAMKKGDLAFFYHSVGDREIVGICEVVKESYPDPTVKPDKLKKDGSNPWVCVDLKAIRKVDPPITLDTIKADGKLGDMVLVNNSRLSVQPVTAAEWKRVCKLGGIDP